MKQIFERCCAFNQPVVAVFTSTYADISKTVHRGVPSVTAARTLAKEFDLPGFWRVKGGAE